MKKSSFYLNAAASVMLAFAMNACTVNDNVSTVETSKYQDGDDLTAIVEEAFAETDNAYIDLPVGIDLVQSAAIEVPAGKTLTIAGKQAEAAVVTVAEGAQFIINDNITLQNVTFEAAAVNTPLIQLAEGTEVTEIAAITLDNVTVKGLAYQLFYANKQNVLVRTLKVDNSLIGINGSNKKTVFDFNGGGNVELLAISNSTIWANPTNAQNGGFFSTQSSKEVTDLGGETATFSLQNNTFYNITNGRTVNTLRKNNQSYQFYNVANNLIVNSGKKGEFLVGLAAGRINNKANWTATGNVINWDGEDIGEAEATKSGLEAPTAAGVVTFADAENGNFTQSAVKAGDPRWIK